MRYGLNVDSEKTFNDPAYLQRVLTSLQELGFDYAEVGVEGLEVISGGRPIPDRVEALVNVLSHFPLDYVIHGPDPLNLAAVTGRDLEARIAQATIELAATVGSRLVVFHTGHVPLVWASRYDAITSAQTCFVETLREIAAFAAQREVALCIENLPPYLDRYLLGDRLDSLVHIVEQVGKENVGICLDFGHAYSAAKYYGFDFLGALAHAKPYVTHVHLHDAHGRGVHMPMSIAGALPQRSALVYGTLHHLPLGWGEVPYHQGLNILKGTDLSITLEISPRYEQYYARCLAEIKAIMEEER
ncbi:MAG: sugar phosphate isomerase/epimerase [Candidatus Acetothermia bacterium]|nr:sugar phosphate isomerase/epimerase [Candidatus Acetothermia bacterium]